MEILNQLKKTTLAPVVKCKLCGRVLSNPESKKLGYGKKCFRIKQLQENDHKDRQELIELKQKWNQLSLKYSILERKLNKLIENGIQTNNIVKSNMEAIERIKLDDHRPERNNNQVNMVVVIQELKIVFNEGVKLEKVDPIFLNHKNIYETKEIII